MARLNKYRECPKCNHKNSTICEKCENCNSDIQSVRIIEAPMAIGAKEGIESSYDYCLGFCMFLDILSYVFLVLGVIGGIILTKNLGWVEHPLRKYDTVFSVSGFGVGISSILFSLAMFGVLGGIKRILEK